MSDGEAVTRVDLSQVSADDLAKALRGRLISEGTTIVWPKEVFNLNVETSVIPCVDGFPLRLNPRTQAPEMGFIRRNTGFYKGRWWCMGGRINKGESFSAALTRHVDEAIGVGFFLVSPLSWNQPAWVAQHAPMSLPLHSDEYAGHEPSKYCDSKTYLIELESENFQFGSTAHGGQEAKEFMWFPLADVPLGDELAYGGDDTVKALVRWVRENY